MKKLLILIMVLAVLLSASRIHDIRSLSGQVDGLSAQLEASMASWQNTASLKEALQEELQQVNNDLREAELTLQESESRETELQAQVEELEAWISGHS